jgi:DNA-directed RNA polymerase subunit RPC12/RpoP
MSEYKCTKCEIKFTSSSTFKYHTIHNVCTKKRGYECSFCNKKFDHKGHYQKHENSHIKKNTIKTNEGFIYIIHEREFIRLKEDTYKIGRTQDYEERLTQYPKSSKLIKVFKVTNMHISETEIKRYLSNIKDIKRKTEYGSEYFETNIANLISNMEVCLDSIDMKYEEVEI